MFLPSSFSRHFVDLKTEIFFKAGIKSMKYLLRILLGFMILTLSGCDQTTKKSSNSAHYLHDGDLLSPTSITPIHKNEPNTPPVAQHINLTTNENNTTTFHLSAQDRDGDPIYYILDKAPTNGNLQGSAAHLTYIPNSNFHGTDSFSYKVNDGSDDSKIAIVTIEVKPNDQTSDKPDADQPTPAQPKPNHAPITKDDHLEINEKTANSINLLDNDSDPDTNDTLTLSALKSIDTTPIPKALYTFDPDGNFLFTPKDYFTNLQTSQKRTLHFTYTVSDQHGNQNDANVTVTIIGVNDAPQADFYQINTTTSGVELDASKSSDIDGRIVDYSWTENSDMLHPISGSSAKHPIFNLPNGDHEITLTVTDNDGATDTISYIIHIESNTQTQAQSDLSNNIFASGLRRISHITIGDFNGDGMPDIAATSGLKVVSFINKSTSFTKYSVSKTLARTIYSAKLDDSSSDRLIIADNNLSICQYNQTGFTCTNSIHSGFRADDQISDIKVANIFGETQPQIFTTSIYEKTINVFDKAQYSSSYLYAQRYSHLIEPEQTQFQFSSNYTGTLPKAISLDINENGDIVDASKNGQIHILRKQGNTYVLDQNITLPQKIKKVAFCGDVGIVAYAYDIVQQDAYLYFKATDSAKFQQFAISSGDIINGTFVCKDINNDKKIDLISALGKQIKLWDYNTTSNQFETKAILKRHKIPITDMKIADMNGDGYVDIVVGDSSGDITTYLMSP